MGKLVEGLWDCPFCGNKRIRAGQKTCPSCGHPQDENTKFYMPDEIKYVSDEEAAKISRNPDWQCSFCGSLNSDNLDSCANCGATKRNLNETILKCGSRKRKKKHKKKSKKHLLREAIQKNQKIFSEKHITSHWYICGNRIYHFGLISCFSPKVRNVTIDDFEWKRTIDVEEIVTYDESGWTLPDDARLQYTKRKSGHTKTLSTTIRQSRKQRQGW